MKKVLPMAASWCNNAWSKKVQVLPFGTNSLAKPMLEKLFFGVLRVLTPLGPRYLRPSWFERLYLLWLFRNFPTLPSKVFNPRQQRFIEAICAHGRFVSFGTGVDDAPPLLIGTLEQRPPVASNLGAPRSAASVADAVTRLAAEARRK